MLEARHVLISILQGIERSEAEGKKPPTMCQHYIFHMLRDNKHDKGKCKTELNLAHKLSLLL